MKTKYIFVTGGVISGIGKGVCAASIGNLLKSRNYSVFSMKLDPYLNSNPGILSPKEHGEVFVTEDGTETDLDLGYYERFIGTNLTSDSSFTSGKLYKKLFEKELSGTIRGKTMQVIPDYTNEIIEVILNISKKYNPDFAIVEIGGTVGDLESNPFFYALAQLNYQYPKNMFFVHVSYLPYISITKEYKTKPTQHSITNLRSLNINPNLIILRSDKLVEENICSKVASISFIERKNIINVANFETIYYLPLYLEKMNIVEIIENHFNLKLTKSNNKNWENFVSKILNQKKLDDLKTLSILMIGSNDKFEDSYKSIKDALIITSAFANYNIKFTWFDPLENEVKLNDNLISTFDGAIILPTVEIKEEKEFDNVLDLLQQKNIPTFGICNGFFKMAFNLINKEKNNIKFTDIISKVANYNEVDFPIRIGIRKIKLAKNSKINKIYSREEISERHKHKYCILDEKIAQLTLNNLVVLGKSQDKKIVEIIENKNNDFYIGVQFRPEYNSKPLDCNPIFIKFIEACINKKTKTQK